MYIHGGSIQSTDERVQLTELYGVVLCTNVLQVFHFSYRDIIYGMNVIVTDITKSITEIFLQFWKIICTAMLIVTISIFVGVIVQASTPSPLRVSFLDVGQGDAILIQTPHGHTMLIDGGGSDRVLEKIAEQKNFFDKHIDVMVETHPDADHITGLISVLAKYKVDTIVTSPLGGHTGIFDELTKSISDEDATIHVGAQGDEIIFGDGVVAHILYPGKKFYGNEKDTNDASVSMVITYGDTSILLTGDLPSTHEAKLLQKTLPRNVTIYKAGHHGSKYSSSEQLLSYIQPEYAIISAGKNNTYGHPSPEAMTRLQTYSQEILSTIDKGTITFSIGNGLIHVKSDK